MNSQKFTSEELKKSKRIFKSATPKYDVSWYVKWFASAFVLAAMSLRGVEGFQLYDLISVSYTHLRANETPEHIG